MTDRNDLARALAFAAQQINAPRSLAETLDVIVHVARDSMPEIDHVGISIANGRGIETAAATDDLVHALDQLQYELGEGPCLHAVDAEPVVVVEHARHEQRWSSYIPRAVALGLRAQLGLRLFVEDETLGGLNMYSTSSDTIGDETKQLAELFATHAALALGRVRREEGLTEALASRKMIGQAIGIVMERYQMDEESAFAYLSRVSQHGNIKLREVARSIVEDSNNQALSREQSG